MMMYDGSGWQPVGSFKGSGMGTTYRLLIWRDTLYACGMFLESEGNPGNNIAAWDGESWHRLQDGVNALGGSPGGSVIRDMQIYNDELWVGGEFRVVNGVFIDDNKHKNIAKWDGTQWCTMDLWMSTIAAITGLGTWKDELFILGGYMWMEDTTAKYILKWTGGDYTDTCVQHPPTGIEESDIRVLALSIYPNPVSDVFTLSFINDGSIATGEKIKIVVTDVVGKIISETEWSVTSGTNRFRMDVNGLPHGTYFVNLSGAGKESAAKIVKL